MIDPSLQNALNTNALLMQAIAAPPKLDKPTLAAAERVVLARLNRPCAIDAARAYRLAASDIRKLGESGDRGDAS